MTIAADNTKNIVDGNDVATTFNFSFKINYSTDLVVVKTDASDVETVLTEGVHYSVTGVGADNGGSITYPLVGDPLPTGEKITMYRVPAIKQLTDLINQGGYYPQTVENALDLLTMIAQMLNEAVDRSIKLDVSDESGADLSVPSPVAGTVLGWNSTADALENISPGNVALAIPADDSIVASMINAAGTQATLDKLLSGNIVKWQKGADVPSAAGLALGSDGNIFDVTGTTAITSIGTVGVGTLVVLQFDGILTLTHHATDLILPGAANITTAAGDQAIFYEYAAGDWRCLGYFRANGDPIFLSGSADGDIYYRSGGQLVRLAKGSDGDLLTLISGAPSWRTSSGSYTPILTAILNVASFGNVYTHYIRVGDRVIVHLLCTVTASGAGTAQFRISLPVSASFTQPYHAIGNGTYEYPSSTYNTGCELFANTSNNEVTCTFDAPGGVTGNLHVNFQYKI